MSRIADFLDRLMRRKVPASVFVTMNPQMQAVRIAVRENGRQSFEDYIREQVAACSRSSVVPDHTLLHLTFPDSKAIPSRRSTTNEYFYGKLAPAFIRQDIHPEPAVSLRDAAFALSKGLSPLSGRAAGTADARSRIPEIYDALCPYGARRCTALSGCNLFTGNLSLQRYAQGPTGHVLLYAIHDGSLFRNAD